MPSKHAWKVDFIPWDFRSAEHAARFREQRVSCGWSIESGPIHAVECAEGRRVVYWVVLSDDVPDRDILMAKHVIKYPKEATPLTDTANELRKTPRVPTEKEFIPIGHIAISIHSPDDDEKLGLPRSGVIWLQALYISFALHRGGIGAGAVEKAEQLAIAEPLNGCIMAVDTAARESHYDEVLMKDSYDDRGLPRPLQSNQDWYERLGYELFARNDDGYKHPLPSGDVFILKVVYLKKNLVDAVN